MKKFWEWMSKQFEGEGQVDEKGWKDEHDKDVSKVKWTEKILIGFMIEYISTHFIPMQNENYISLEFRFRMSVWHNNIYNELCDIITKISE